MKITLKNNLVALACISSVLAGHAEARTGRLVANNEKTRVANAEFEQSQEEELPPTTRTRKKSKNPSRPTENKTDEGYWYVRIQQLPLLGLAAVSDNGVVDIETMKVVNRNFHIGPTAVYHFSKQADTKMQSLNLGVRADLILGDLGHLEDIYISTALMFGRFESKTVKYKPEDAELYCNFSSKGFHRVGAFALGKVWTLSDSLHVTTGLGAVKSKTASSTDDKLIGNCPASVTDSDGTTLPWFDFGVGFRI